MIRRLRILNAENRDFCEEARELLRSFAVLEEGDFDRPMLLREVGGCDALIVRLGHLVDDELLGAAAGLGVVATATTGLDHIDLRAAARRKVEVLSLKGETEFLMGVTATAEHTWALLLALIRRLPEAAMDVRRGGWQRDLFRGRELGRTLGVVGFGRLGRMVAGYGVAFGMKVVVTDPVLPAVLPVGVLATSLDGVLADADVVSLHVPLAAETTGLIDARAFSKMRLGSVLINTSRGEVVDAAALVAALDSGRLAGAALDVVGGERQGAGSMVDHPLIAYAARHANLLITPHIGGATWDSHAAHRDLHGGEASDLGRAQGL